MHPEVGEIFDGTVTSVVPFGLFVERPAGGTGLLHGDSGEVGSAVRVQVLEVDHDNERFSLKRV